MAQRKNKPRTPRRFITEAEAQTYLHTLDHQAIFKVVHDYQRKSGETDLAVYLDYNTPPPGGTEPTVLYSPGPRLKIREAAIEMGCRLDPEDLSTPVPRQHEVSFWLVMNIVMRNSHVIIPMSATPMQIRSANN